MSNFGMSPFYRYSFNGYRNGNSKRIGQWSGDTGGGWTQSMRIVLGRSTGFRAWRKVEGGRIFDLVFPCCWYN